MVSASEITKVLSTTLASPGASIEAPSDLPDDPEIRWNTTWMAPGVSYRPPKASGRRRKLPAKLARFRCDCGFVSRLNRVVVNAAHDARRRMSARRRNETLHAELEMLQRAAEAARAGQLAWLRQALDSLPEDLPTTATLVCSERLRHAAAGEILGVSEATVSWRMHELRKRLRAMPAGEEKAVP